MLKTIQELGEEVPYQIFLGNPRALSGLHISENELREVASIMGHRRVYVHAPYIINLCMAARPMDTNAKETLIKNLQYAVLAGFRGVVVHVGKSLKMAPDEALSIMLQNIMDVLEHATPECPLLLETPAGQGTEMLTSMDAFLQFASEISRDISEVNFGICLDTCHVFTCGHDPLEYAQKAHATGLLRLVHFNDSASACGDCVDRHAFIGTGKIGAERLRTIAAYCSRIAVDMVIE